ncbi:RNA polymerase sigma factor, sigma-70 family [compost metagenome]
MPPKTHVQVETFYAHHHGWLHGWLRRQLGNSCEAADLAHDVFVRLLCRPTVIEPREPRAYLSAIARGLLMDHWRRRELERAWLEVLARTPEELAPSPESRMLVLEALIKIDQMLDALKPRVRQAFCGHSSMACAARRLPNVLVFPWPPPSVMWRRGCANATPTGSVTRERGRDSRLGCR